MPQPPRPARKGDRITAARQNAVEEMARANAVNPIPGAIHYSRGYFGTNVIPSRNSGGSDGFWIRLTAAGTGGTAGYFYAYTRVHGGAGVGTWVDESQHGVIGETGATAPALEVNQTVGLPVPSYHRAWAEPATRQVRFQADPCQATSGGGGTGGPVPGTPAGSGGGTGDSSGGGSDGETSGDTTGETSSYRGALGALLGLSNSDGTDAFSATQPGTVGGVPLGALGGSSPTPADSFAFAAWSGIVGSDTASEAASDGFNGMPAEAPSPGADVPPTISTPPPPDGPLPPREVFLLISGAETFAEGGGDVLAIFADGAGLASPADADPSAGNGDGSFPDAPGGVPLGVRPAAPPIDP